MVPKDSPLAEVLLEAFKTLHENGTYDSIMEKWDLDANMLESPGINMGVESDASHQIRCGAGRFGDTVAERARAQLDVRNATRRKHPLRWAASLVVLVLVAQFVNMLVTNDNFGWPIVAQVADRRVHHARPRRHACS